MAAAVAVGLAAAPAARAQVFESEVPAYSVSGRLLLSYAGSWQEATDRPVATHLLVEGGELTLRGWIWESRYVRFRATLLATREDEPGLGLHGYTLGYGASLYLLTRSVLPITLDLTRGLAVAGSTAEQATALSTTAYTAAAQLASPELPHVDARAQRVETQGQDGTRATNDAVVASVYGTAPLQRYAGVFTWNADQYGTQPRTSRFLAALTDDFYPSQDTQGHLQATITQGNGFGGATDAGFTGYQASATVLSRLSPGAVLRTGYAFAQLASAGANETSNMLSAGSTIRLSGSTLILGEGLAAGAVTTDTDVLHRSVRSVTASQGVATSGRLGPLDLGASVTGQAGYTAVSDGGSGALLGYSAAVSGQYPLAGAPLHGYAQYSVRDDRSAAGLGERAFTANLTGTITRLWPVVLLPYVTFLRFERTDPASPGGWTDSSAFAATLSGTAPVLRTAGAFAAGYSDTWSRSSPRSSFVFGRASDAVRLAPGTFANATVDLAHFFGGATTASLLAAATWTFRESQLAVSYTYSRSWPGDGGQHSVAFVYSRGFSATFLPESR
jgi:hypothetical protein